MNTELNNHIFINTSILKNIIAKIVRQTPGIGEKAHFFTKSIKSDNNENKVIDIIIDENNKAIINFGVSITHPNLMVEIPTKLQTQIQETIKTYFGLESKINIKVINILD